MGKKCLKFISISDVLEELKNTLMMQSEVQKQKEIGLILASFEEFEIRKDVLKAHPSDFIERNGLWIESDDNKKFYYGIELKILAPRKHENSPMDNLILLHKKNNQRLFVRLIF